MDEIKTNGITKQDAYDAKHTLEMFNFKTTTLW